jgi:hypothetical protein
MENKKQKNPLRIILNTSIFAFFILLIAFVCLKILIVYDPDGARKNTLTQVVTNVEEISKVGWNLIKPFLQLVIILLIVEWILNKLGISFTSKESKVEWNVQTIIAIIIVVAFALAALSGIAGVESLKELSLVVIGFYFGSKRRVEYRDGKGGEKVIEEFPE